MEKGRRGEEMGEEGRGKRGKKRGQEGKERQEKVLVRVSGKFFVQSVVGGKVRTERKEGE